MSVPQIRTAIPKRRYQLGEFLVTVLGEVESGDAVAYRYIMAVAREADPRPHLFVNAERNPAPPGGDGLLLRVAMADGSQVLGTSDRWNDIEVFTHEALAVVTRMLNLGDESAFRLM